MYYNRDGTRFQGDTLEWARNFEKGNRVVRQTHLWNGYYVSTIFLGMDHSFGVGPPVIFETMIFFQPGDWNILAYIKKLLRRSVDKFEDLDMQRYSSEEGAAVGHELMVRKWRRRLW